MVWVRIQCSFKPILVGVCYRPPSESHSFTSRLHDDLSTLFALYPAHPVFLFGDFNFPCVNWNSAVPVCPKGNGLCKDFLDMCLDFNLFQLVSVPTRVTDSSSSILDLVLTTHPGFVESPLTCIDGVSDHRVIYCPICVEIQKPLRVQKSIRLYEKGNYEQLCNSLSEYFVSFNTNFESRSVDINWCLFKDKLCDLVEKYIPCIDITTKSSNPWFNRSLKSLRNKKQRLFRVARRAGTPESWQSYEDCAKIYKIELNRCKDIFYRTTLPSLLIANPQRFWNVVRPKDECSLQLVSNSGDPVPVNLCANVLNDVFSKVFSRSDLITVSPPVSSISFPMDPILIDYDGIVNIIKSLKVSSSCGIDSINSKILRNTNLTSSLFLTKIFRQSLETGVVPEDWKFGKVIPVHKSGSRSSPANYRPISLTCISSKIMEHIIFKHLVSFLDSNSFFSDVQHGFRRNFSCETQLLHLTNDLFLNLDSGYPTIAVFLDFAKAFDKVPHKLLLLKLSTLNIDAHVLIWIESFLSQRRQYVYANNASSHVSAVSSGVPQGTVLGPLLFLIYINDLPLRITSVIRLFADDCVVYRKITTQDDLLILQADLLKITDWCQNWKMSLNTNKCKCMRFSNSLAETNPTLLLDGTILEYTDHYKYLGVHLSPNLSWNTHINNIVQSANRSLGYIRRNFRSVPNNLKRLLYVTLVRPKLEYASSIWHPHQSTLTDLIESVQSRAARFIFSDYSRFSSVSLMKAHLDLPLLSSRRRISRLCLLHKVFYTPIFKQSLLNPPSYISARIDHPCKIARPQCFTLAHQKALLPSAIVDWNDLPENLIGITDSGRFRDAITNYFM